MTKQKRMKLVNKLAEKLLKDTRRELGIRAISKDQKAELMAAFTMTIYDHLQEAGVFDGES